MSFDTSRLRGGEIASGVGGVLLLSWPGRRRFPLIRWLSLPTAASALALTYTQATRRAPAVPVALSVVVTALGSATAVGLLSRAVVGRAHPPRAYFGLLAASTIAAGGFASMRQEGGTDPGALGELETITLEP